MSDDGDFPSSSHASDGPTVELCPPSGQGPWTVEVGSPTMGRALTLEPNSGLVLGSGRQCDVRVEDRTVSARHVRLEAIDGGLTVEDLGSRNGLYIGAARVGRANLVGAAPSFVIGRTTVTVRGRDGSPEEPARLGEPVGSLLGASVPMRRLFAEVRRCAALRAPVLVQGESGSGKDVVARALHVESRRKGQYVPLNVGTIAETLADAELFGHRRGAFTGAVAASNGAFLEADGGTLFLDEIAELPPSIQVKLLRVVEEGRVRPVGASQTTAVDVRIVSATWAPLDERVAAGRFREDLYHRIATFVVRVPPLRSRKSDIPALCHGILGRLRDELGPKRLDSAALSYLVSHSWPGNVRELGSVLYRAAARADGEDILARDVEGALVVPGKVRPRALSSVEASRLLDEHSGNISAASRSAGVARSTFRTWLRK